MLYNEGKGVAVDYAEAARWFRRAARHDLGDAQMELGFMRASGRPGVPQDPVQAYVWFFLAAENGVHEAVTARDRVGDLLDKAEKADANARIADWEIGKRGTD